MPVHYECAAKGMENAHLPPNPGLGDNAIRGTTVSTLTSTAPTVSAAGADYSVNLSPASVPLDNPSTVLPDTAATTFARTLPSLPLVGTVRATSIAKVTGRRVGTHRIAEGTGNAVEPGRYVRQGMERQRENGPIAYLVGQTSPIACLLCLTHLMKNIALLDSALVVWIPARRQRLERSVKSYLPLKFVSNFARPA